MIIQIAVGLSRWSRAGPLAVSCAAFVVAFAPPSLAGPSEICGRASSLTVFWLNLETLDLSAWALRWTAMLCAMMVPLLILPIEHIERTTLRRNLQRSIVVFVTAYLAVWIPAGAIIAVIATLLRETTSPDLIIWGVVAAVLLWSASPIAQVARNRAHRRMPLAVQGWAAFGDCLHFGSRTGWWCISACWPWMLLCETLPVPHAITLPLVSAVLLAERAMPPTMPHWQLPRFAAFVLAMRPYNALGRL